MYSFYSCFNFFQGKLIEVISESEVMKAKKVLFKRHPSMKLWPSNHEFKVFKFDIENLFLINFYGGAPKLSVEDYFKIQLG